MNRREFVLKSAALAGVAAAGPRLRLGAATLEAGVTLINDPADPVAGAAPVHWALGQLHDALAAQGFRVSRGARVDDSRPGDLVIAAAGGATRMARELGGPPLDGPEALAIAPGRLGVREVLLAAGSDARGLAYALTELADAVALAGGSAAATAALRPTQAVVERAANAVRSVMAVFASDVEDRSWYYSRSYWRNYLSLLATQRFNRVNLAFGLGYDGPTELIDTYFYFPYPFLVTVPGYNVRVDKLPDRERDENLAMLRFISDEAARRGIEFYLGLWNHAYAWTNSPAANHVITGLTPEAHAPYSRDALALILKECPAITGVTFRIHSESGVSGGRAAFWKTVFDGCVRSGRPVEFDLHAKGMNEETLGAALATGHRVDVSPKFSAEHQSLPYHQAAIRPDERVSAAREMLLRYGYGDLMTVERRYGVFHRIWPGTQRMLLWGDPAFAAAYARAGGFCGSRGLEIFAQLAFKGRKGGGLPGGRDGYADLALRAPGDDFEKFRFTYRVWGRLLYNPDSAPAVWQRQLRAEHGAAAGAVEASLASASRILPLITTAHLPSAANNNYWPEVPVNQSMVKEETAKPFLDTLKPRRFGNVSPLDPQLFYPIDAYVDDVLHDKVDGRYTPLEVAGWLDHLVEGTERPVARVAARGEVTPPTSDPNQFTAVGTTAATSSSPAVGTGLRPGRSGRGSAAFRRFRVDTAIVAQLGTFMSLKLRAGVLYSIHERTGALRALEAALNLYRDARAVWAQIDGQHAYVDDLTYGYAWFQRGSWQTRLQAIDDDIVLLERLRTAAGAAATTVASKFDAGRIASAIALAESAPMAASPQLRPAAGVRHEAPQAFRRGEPVALTLVPEASAATPQAARLFYRRVNQAEPWRSLAMAKGAEGFAATIPAEYTDSGYPLMYYFEVRRGVDGAPTLYPGLAATMDNQPYWVVRRAV